MRDITKYYSKKEVAEALGVCKRTVERWIKQGKLKGAIFGSVWRFRNQDIEDLYNLLREETESKIRTGQFGRTPKNHENNGKCSKVGGKVIYEEKEE